MNPTQLELAQTYIVCSSYDDLFILSNRQKKCSLYSLYSSYSATWHLTGHTDDVAGTLGDDMVGSYS
jgi:hypothetical protein